MRRSNFFFLFLGDHRDIDKVDATMDDIRDQMDVANEISEAISRPVGMGEDLDEVKSNRNRSLCYTNKNNRI